MENKQKQEELKLILESIHRALELYNDLTPEQKMQITPKAKDISNIYICVYDEIHVGLFQKTNWCGPVNIWNNTYDAGIVYLGIDSNYVGMKKTHTCNYSENRWQPIGTKTIVDGKGHVANCEMQDCMSFDDMRLIMYKEGQIGPYEIGKASSQEILEVLKYATSYYELDKKAVSKKRQ